MSKFVGFNNGSTIEAIDVEKNMRSKRSELISFYCPYCDEIHVDYNYTKNKIYVIDDRIFCKEVEILLVD